MRTEYGFLLMAVLILCLVISWLQLRDIITNDSIRTYKEGKRDSIGLSEKYYFLTDDKMILNYPKGYPQDSTYYFIRHRTNGTYARIGDVQALKILNTIPFYDRGVPHLLIDSTEFILDILSLENDVLYSEVYHRAILIEKTKFCDSLASFKSGGLDVEFECAMYKSLELHEFEILLESLGTNRSRIMHSPAVGPDDDFVTSGGYNPPPDLD